ncbi:DUF3140 domain-containing protein [Herbiconiux sp. VKM Ac-1786]|uniref:DUF3140 domain-containing protein n=1 Tax=Herbiconiux sp. VKM Ac-1786 TaxID=2783824 RepID=UPI00188AAF2A|nr:DUF3140 domain-containing protein [Herbiconiux sp. VKM Ac-1786]MBF4574348.1 DUF3140 domain-containing protein [Herbiconiux sp. VKM Ac-1786]
MAENDETERDDVRKEFDEAVTMTAGELEDWLDTDESTSVGQKDGGQGKDGGGESVGHHSGRRIVEILHTKKADLTDDDVAHMKKVVGYVHRHLAQRPDGDVTDTPWRWSLMNWGHDPLKKNRKK